MVDKQIVADVRRMDEDGWREICTAIAEEVAIRKELSERETEIMMMLLAGWQNADITKHLGIAEKTLKGHMHVLYRLFEARSRGEFLGSIFPLRFAVPKAPKAKWGHGWRGKPGRL
jgi:DNA-binding NarL/FixJ family response regulator